VLHALKNGSSAIPPKISVEDGRDDSLALLLVLVFFSSAGAKTRRGRRGKEKKGEEGK
jgi:hypothetical protein